MSHSSRNSNNAHTHSTNAIILLLRNLLSPAISIVSYAVASHYLKPIDYAIIGYASIVLSYISVAIGQGLTPVLVRVKNISIEQESTFFWVQMLLAIVLVSLIWVGTIIVSIYFSGIFFDSQKIILAIRALSISLLFIPLRVVPLSRLERALEFKVISSIELVSALINAILIVVLTFSNWGYLGVITAQVVSSVFTSIMFISIQRKPSFVYFSWERSKDIIKYGVQYQASTCIGLLKDLWKPVLITGMLGPISFGYVQWAKTSIQQLGAAISSLNRLFMPIINDGRSNKDSEKLIENITIVFAAFCVSISVPLFVFSHSIITIVFGLQWLPAEKLFLCFVFDLFVVGLWIPYYQAVLCFLKGSYLIKYGLLLLLGEWLISMFAIYWFGLIGAGFSSIILGLFFPIFYVLDIHKNLGWSFNPFKIMPVYILSSLVFSCMSRLLVSQPSSFFQLIVYSLISATSYLFVLFVFYPRFRLVVTQFARGLFVNRVN